MKVYYLIVSFQWNSKTDLPLIFFFVGKNTKIIVNFLKWWQETFKNKYPFEKHYQSGHLTNSTKQLLIHQIPISANNK